MTFLARFAVLSAAFLSFSSAALAQNTAPLGPLQAQDARLATIAERLQAANLSLCAERMPLAGFVIHSADQYADGAAVPGFAQGPVALAAVVPGSAAEAAGLLPGDTLVAINGRRLSELELLPGAPLRDSVFEFIAGLPASAPMTLAMDRAGDGFGVVLDPRPGCRALVEIITGEGLVGRSDGRVIQISYDLAAMLDDASLAVIFAHELAHSVLQHRARLVAAGVSKGLLGEVGRNQQLNRQVEIEADRLSAHLLANAGYDPGIAPAFWNSASGRRAGGGILRSFIYPSPTSRGDLIAREIEQYLPLEQGPSWPGHLLVMRERPF